jgi:hypothetical protein
MLNGVTTTTTTNNNKENAPIVNAALVKNLLLQAGEVERAADDVLVEQMVQAATPPGVNHHHHHSGCLDMQAFVHALTDDLKLWEVGAEDRLTSSFFDVFGFESYREAHIVQQQQEEAQRATAKLQKQEESNHRLSTAGLVVSSQKEETNEIDEDDITVEDDIVPSVVKFNDKRNHHHQYPSISASASVDESIDMSVVTLDLEQSSVVDTTRTTPKDTLWENDEPYKLDRTHTPLDIDFSIDMHSSIVLTVLIFFFFMATSLVYAVLILQIPALNPQCGEEFGCILGTKVITWMVFAFILAGTGYFVIIPLR